MSFDATMAWYIKLASSEATKAHAWHQVRELARDWPEVFGELPERLTAAMKQQEVKA